MVHYSPSCKHAAYLLLCLATSHCGTTPHVLGLTLPLLQATRPLPNSAISNLLEKLDKRQAFPTSSVPCFVHFPSLLGTVSVGDPCQSRTQQRQCCSPFGLRSGGRSQILPFAPAGDSSVSSLVPGSTRGLTWLRYGETWATTSTTEAGFNTWASPALSRGLDQDFQRSSSAQITIQHMHVQHPSHYNPS